MFKPSILVALGVALSAFASMAVPAMGWFESKNGGTSGNITPLKAGEFSANGASFKCPLAGMSGTWKIRSTGKLEEEIKGPLQTKTKEGPHLQLEIQFEKTKNGCEAGVGGLKLAADVAPEKGLDCVFQLKQNKGVFTAQADVVEPCFITIPAAECTLEVPTANEKTGLNFQLTKVELSNNGTNQIDKVEVKGISVVTKNKGCPKGITSAEFKNFEFEPVGENAV